ncbi:MAG: hypothetical protein WC901_00245, partial [Candidatus Margulisiibacteriota bacterium]
GGGGISKVVVVVGNGLGGDGWGVGGWMLGLGFGGGGVGGLIGGAIMGNVSNWGGIGQLGSLQDSHSPLFKSVYLPHGL